MTQKLGQYLLEKGLLTEKDLEEARRIQNEGSETFSLPPGEKIGKIIVACNFVPPMDVVRAICEQRRVDDYILAGRYIVSPSLVARVPLEVAKRFNVLPLVCIDEVSGESLVATCSQPSADDTHELETLLGFRIDWIELDDRHFDSAIERVYARMAERGLSSVRIGEVLVRDGLVNAEEVDWALQLARTSNTLIGRVLIEEGLILENTFYQALARQKGIPLVKASDILAGNEASAVASRLSANFAIFNEIVPFRLDDAVIHVAVGDTEKDFAELLKIYSCKKVALHMVNLSGMIALLRSFYGLSEDEAQEKGFRTTEAVSDVELLSEIPAGGAAGRATSEDFAQLRRRYESLVTNLLQEAIRRRASDIHMEHYENFVAVRLRIDGLLYDARTLRIDKENISGVVNVIKVLSDINIAERRLPQGGRFRKRTSAGEIFDFRVQVQPTLFGENVVIRLLNQTSSIVPLTDLGFSPRNLDRFLAAIINPSGLVLITGPTGSGKTTTLYSTLDLLRRDTTKKIVTIEDPIEYSLPRIQQSQTLDAINYNFAAATRSFLRQDPDVALVGEIRDEETAHETIKLSQTGHLVFSTLHTNNAVGAAPRLFVLGVDSELLASELLVVVAQRLARKLCPECKVPYKPKPDILEDLYPLGVPKGLVFHRGVGCPNCDSLGHVGRTVLGEFWFIDRDSRLLISRRADEDTIRRETTGVSSFPLLADALEKVQEGVIDISELPTVLPMASISSTARLIQEKNLLPPIGQAAG